ncbi:MAG: metallophosphoesterase family protein [Clostridia bacterium]
MTKIGIFSDTHGNLFALETMYNYFIDNGCEEIIHCGDMITMGAQSKECLDFFFSHPITMVRGNHDMDYVLNRVSRRGESQVSQEHKEFIFASLGETYKERIRQLPLVVYREFYKVKFAFMHYALSRDKQFTFTPIYQQPTIEIFDDIFSGIDADCIFYGHKHEPCDMQGVKRYIDVGSVGCRKESDVSGIILTVCPSGYKVERIYLPYPRQKVLQTMLDRNIPDSLHIFDYYFKEAENK